MRLINNEKEVNTLSKIEQLLLEASSSNLQVLCHAMRAIQVNFLHPNSEYMSLENFVNARRKPLQLGFGGSSAALYALGSQVFTDLSDFDFKPVSIAQLRVLTKLDMDGRVSVWKIADSLEDRTQITRQFLEDVATQVGAGRRRAAPLVSASCESIIEVSQKSTLEVFTSTETDRWGTPSYLIEASRVVLGDRIDLDPFSEPAFNKRVKAKNIYTRRSNGYKKSWFGNVFLNAPGGLVNGESAMGMAFEKAKKEYRAGRISAAVCLLKAAIGYKWFEAVYAYPLCFLRDRPKFHEPGGDVRNESPHGYVVVYIGRERTTFQKVFSSYGQVYTPA
jgi:hypothetical protein